MNIKKKIVTSILGLTMFLTLLPANRIEAEAPIADTPVAAENTADTEATDTLDTEQPTETERAAAQPATDDGSSPNHVLINGVYLFDKGTNTLIRYQGNEENLSIPDKLEYEGQQYDVLHIGDFAFSGVETRTQRLSSLELPEGLLTIGANAFVGEQLTALTIPASVQEIKERAFYGNKLTTLVLKDGSHLTAVGDFAFSENELENLDLSKATNLVSLGVSAFENNHLATALFPTEATFASIGNKAFFSNNLEKVSLSDGIKTYGTEVFGDNGKFVIVETENPVVTSQVSPELFGSIVNPAFFYVRGVDADGKEILSARKYANDLYSQLSPEEMIALGNNLHIQGPNIPGYVSEMLDQEPLSKAFVDAHATPETAYVFTYTRNESKPVLKGLTPLRVPVAGTINFLEGVSAETAAGVAIPANRIRYLPNKIDTSFEAIHKVTYTVTDPAGNKASGVRTIIVGNDIMQLETGKGWVMGDFTYDGGKVTGFSESGLEKLKVNREVVLPTFNPTNPDNLELITVIGENAFSGKELLTVVLPDNLVEIQDNAFGDNKLVSVGLPDGLKKIGASAFKNNQLTSAVLPEEFATLGASAFENNKLTKIAIPSSVTDIPERAFYGNNLVSVGFPETLKTIGASSFESNQLTEVQFPVTLAAIGENAFAENRLKSVTIPDSVTSLGGYAFTKNQITEYTIGKGVTAISEGLFKDNKLKSVHLPDHITEIKNSAFEKNELTDVSIPSNIIKIGDMAFHENYLLRNISFAEGLASIGDKAFHKVDLKMKELVLPSSLRTVGNSAFYGAGTTSTVDKIVFNEGITSIGPYAFSDIGLKSIETTGEPGKLPTTITQLGGGVFARNNLRILTLPENITRVPNNFAESNKLDTLKLGSKVTEIGSSAFSYNNLNLLDLREQTPLLQKIETSAFYRNTMLRTLKLGDAVTEIGPGAFQSNSSLSDVELGSGLKKIGSNAFRDTTSLTHIDFPESLESIGSYSFYSSRLSEVTIPDSVTSVENDAFRSNNLTKVRLSQNLSRIAESAFSENKLTEIEIPASVREIGRLAFSHNQISDIIVAENSKLENIRDFAFEYNQLGRVTLPPTVKRIEKYAFRLNPGASETPDVVRVFIKDGETYVDSVIPDSPYMAINKTPITIYSLERDTDLYIKNPEVVLKKIGEQASFIGKANRYYEPVSEIATEVTVTEKPEDIKIYYAKTSNYNIKNIQLDMQFTDPQKNPLGYGLKEDTNTEYSYRNYTNFLITLNITDEAVFSSSDPYIDIDFNNPTPGGFFRPADISNIRFNNMNSTSSPLMLDADYRNLFRDVKFINDTPTSAKLRLFFKPGVLKPNKSLGFGFRYRGAVNAPHNSVLDLTGAVTFGTQDSELPLAATSPDNHIGVRHSRLLPSVTKSGSNMTYIGKDYLVSFNGRNYASDAIVPRGEYIISLADRSDRSRQYTYENVTLKDTLPTYQKYDAAQQKVVTATAQLDEAASVNWRYLAGSDNRIVEFIGPDIKEVSKFPIYLKFPGAQDRTEVYNKVDLTGPLGLPFIKTLNGTLEEANQKFNNPAGVAYENITDTGKTPFTENGRYDRIIIGNEYPSDTNKSESSKDLYLYKRTVSFFGNGTKLFPQYSPRYYRWYYNGNSYDSSATSYQHFKSATDGSTYYYYSFMPNIEKYRSKEIEYAIEMSVVNGKGKDLVYKDTNLDPLLQYKRIGIPAEFKKAKLKLYTSTDATGSPAFEGVIFNDPYVLTKQQQDTIRSYSLEFEGETEGTPFTSTAFVMNMTAEFKNPQDEIDIKDRYRHIGSGGSLSGKVFFEERGESSFSRSYTEKFAVTPVGDLVTNFSKTRVLPGCPNPMDPSETEEDCAIGNHLNEVFPGTRISFSYSVSANGFLQNSYSDFVLYDKLPKGLSYLRFIPDPNFLKLVSGYKVETTADSTGRNMIRVKADKIKFSESSDSDIPIDRIITIGRLDAVANSEITNGNYTNFAYISMDGMQSNRQNVKQSLGNKADDNLVDTYRDSKYKIVLEASAPYRASISTGIAGELTERKENDTIWTPFVVKPDETGNYEYRIRMINQKNTPEGSYTIYAALPDNHELSVVPDQQGNFLPGGTHIEGVDETGARITDRARLRGPIQISDPKKLDSGADPYYEVFYTFEPRENLNGTYADNVVTNNSLWLTKDQVNGEWDRVTGFKIISKKDLSANSHDDYILSMKAPENPDYLYDNLPFSEDFLAANGLKHNRIVFKFASALNPIVPIDGAAADANARSRFTSGNRVETILESPRSSLQVTKKGFDPKKHQAQREDETDEEFLNRLPVLKGASFELYMVGKDTVDPASALITVGEKFPELTQLKDYDNRKDIPKIVSLKIFKEPVRFLVNGEYKTKIISDDLGKVDFINLIRSRDYILREVDEPQGYQTPIFEKWKFISKTLLLDDTPVQLSMLNSAPLLMDLKPIRASVSLRKVDVLGNPIPFTRFRLVRVNEDNSEAANIYLKTGFTDDSGNLKFDDMPLGKYKLEEIGPRGALQPVDPIVFYAKRTYDDTDIILGDTDISDYHYALQFKKPIVNHLAKIDVFKLGVYDSKAQEKVNDDNLISLRKTDGKPLKDVTLRIASEDGTVTKELKTDGFGKVTFKDLEVNKNYIISEVKTPDGFNPYTKPYKVRIDEIGVIYINDIQNNFEYVVYPNVPKENFNRIDIKKVDESGEVPLRGAKFTLYEISATNELIEIESQTSDENGDLVFKRFAMDGNLPLAKRFVVKETEPPLGYTYGEREFQFETNETNFVYLSKEIRNPKIELIVDKVDGVTQDSLANAEFALYEMDANQTLIPVQKDGNPVVAISNQQGVAKFDYDAFDIHKIYAVKETKAPEGYEASKETYLFDLKGLSETASFTGSYELTIPNTPKKGKLTISKLDFDTRRPIAGVVFELKNKQTNVKQTQVTDNFGAIQFTLLDIGTYELSEKQPAAGYLPAESMEIEITRQNLNVKKIIYNKRHGVSLVLDKVSEQGHKLQNAKFSLERSILGDFHYGTPLYRSSDAQGTVTFDDLKVGYTYRLREVEADKPIEPNTAIGAIAGYQKNTTIWFITPKINVNHEVELYVRTANQAGETKIDNALEIVNERKVPQSVSVHVHKTLNGGENLSPMPAFEVTLQRGFSEDTLTTVAASQKTLVKQPDGSFTTTYTDLPYDAWDATQNKWVPYIYRVQETAVANFTPHITKNASSTAHEVKFDIVNTYSTPTRTIQAKKQWVDGGANKPQTYLALFRKVAGENEFTLVNDSIQEVPASTDTSTTYTWNDMPITDQSGRTYIYQADETTAQGVVVERVGDYIKSLEYDNQAQMYVVKNTYSSPTNKFLVVKKNWVNGLQQKPIIYFRLYRKIAGGQKVAVTDDQLLNNQTAIKVMNPGTIQLTYTNLEKTDSAAREYIYSVVETDSNGNELNLGAMYEDQTNTEAYHNTVYSYAMPEYDETEENTVKVTNTYVIPKISVEGKLTWVNGPAEKPVTWLTLYRKVGPNGLVEKVEGPHTKEIRTPDTKKTTTVTFENLDKTNENGEEYIYLIKETSADGSDFVPENYTKDEEDVTRDPLHIRNMYRSPKGNIAFTKVWRNGHYYRPVVSFRLYRSINDVREVVPDVQPMMVAEKPIDEVSEEDRIEVVFENIDLKNLNGVDYVFDVEEILPNLNIDDVPGRYEMAVSADNREVTNTFKSKNIDLTLSKIWKNTKFTRPKVYFKLYRELDTTVLERLGLEIDNQVEEVALTSDNFEEEYLEETKQLEGLNDPIVNPAGAVDIDRILVPERVAESEIEILVHNLPYAADNAIPYRYFIKEYSVATDAEFVDSDYAVQNLTDLSIENRYIRVEPSKSSSYHPVVFTATKTGFIYYVGILGISLLILGYLWVFKRKQKNK